MPKILIDSTCRILYASYYIQGLYEYFGRKNVSFNYDNFKELNRYLQEFSFEHYFAFIIIHENGTKNKIIIDFCDATDINQTAYFWCDYYSKINFNPSETPTNNLPKIINIPPAFGIKIWNIWETAFFCFQNLLRSKLKPIVPLKIYLKDYVGQFNRPKLSDYTKSSIKIENLKQPYIFLIATLWGENGKSANQKRKEFIESVITSGCNFEGGFLVYKNDSNSEEYFDYVFKKPYKTMEYVNKTKLSNFVFNTPAVHNCLGWKIAEYLAMGKAIISMPLSNNLPNNLVNGINIHFMIDECSLKTSVDLLIKNQIYREKLSEGSKKYFQDYMEPRIVIKNIFDSIKKI